MAVLGVCIRVLECSKGRVLRARIRALLADSAS